VSGSLTGISVIDYCIAVLFASVKCAMGNGSSFMKELDAAAWVGVPGTSIRSGFAGTSTQRRRKSEGEEAVVAAEVVGLSVSATAPTASAPTSRGSGKVGEADLLVASGFAASPTLVQAAGECAGTMRFGQAGVQTLVSFS
jgi:hypothetical protein